MKKPYDFTKNKAMWQEAQKVIPGGTQATRGPSWSVDTVDYPYYFDKADGCRMWDIDGNEFIDLICSIGPVILGYTYDRVDDAVQKIIKSSFQSSSNHPVQLELAKLLIEVIPCAEQVRFLKTGTEATQAAVRLARHITKRTYVARSGYHGWADMWWHGRTEGIHSAAWQVIPPFDGTAEGLKELFASTPEKFAAVILCPADTRPFTQENYQGIVDVAHQHGAIVIFDEVKSGFRMALGGAQEVLKVTPDLTTISKGMGNGYPIAAVVGKEKYMKSFIETPTAGTFSVEAIGLVAALETIREMKEKNVSSHLNKMGQRFIDGLNKICRKYEIEGAAAYPDPVPAMPRFTWKPYTNDFSHPAHCFFFKECFRYGLFFTNWHVAFVNYSHKEKDIDEALDICDFVMAKTQREFQ